MYVCCWLSGRCPQPPGTPQDGRVLMRGEQSWKRCCTRALLPRTYLPRNIYRPPEKAGKYKDHMKIKKKKDTHNPVNIGIQFFFFYLLYVSIVGSADKFFQFSQTVCFSQGKDELRLHVGLPRFLSSHLEEFYQIFPVICNTNNNTRSSYSSKLLV